MLTETRDTLVYDIGHKATHRNGTASSMKQKIIVFFKQLNKKASIGPTFWNLFGQAFFIYPRLVLKIWAETFHSIRDGIEMFYEIVILRSYKSCSDDTSRGQVNSLGIIFPLNLLIGITGKYMHCSRLWKRALEHWRTKGGPSKSYRNAYCRHHQKTECEDCKCDVDRMFAFSQKKVHS